MRIALISPPFIPVPPTNYGGTELFIGHLACGLKKLGHEVVVYSNGEATIPVERRWIYPKSEWPIKGEVYDSLKDINHTAWAVRDAALDADLIHLNNAPGRMSDLGQLLSEANVNIEYAYGGMSPTDPAGTLYLKVSDVDAARAVLEKLGV
jgi:hypothetical protein